MIEIPSVSLFLQSGENILEIFDTDTNETKTIIFNYDHSLPEIHADYFTYQMPLGQTAIFPISSDDLCEELVSIENICPELAEDAPVDFTLQEDQKVKFKANELGIGHACYKICEESGRCDTFTLRVDVYLPESEEEIVSPEDSLIIHNLYPNPASSILHFTEPFNVFIQKIIIYNSTGKLVDEIRLNESYIYDLDVSRYAEGLYIAVRHLENKEIFVEKFIVQH